VTAAAHGELEPGLTGDRDHARHLGRVTRLGDCRRAAVDPAREDLACAVVLGVVGKDHAAVERRSQVGDLRQVGY
jgi:hypothetical protein